MLGRKFMPVARWMTAAYLFLLLFVVVGCGQTPSPGSQAAKPEPLASPAETLNVGTVDEVVSGIAGIQPGSMADADVVAMYGPGGVYGYQDQPADRRYYTDPSHSVTLMSGWHTDGIVMAVELTEGTALPPDVDPALTAAPLSVPVKIDKGIALGMTPDEVISRLGEPQHDSTTDGGNARTLSYEVWADDPAEDGWISYNAVLAFVDGRLHRIAVYSGD
jgi:hypothetical protein